MENTILFRDLLREWWERFPAKHSSKRRAKEIWSRLEREVLPDLGSMSPKEITPPMILGILRRIEARGAMTTTFRTKSHISRAMCYGIACGVVVSDPTRDLRFALTKHISRPFPAITLPVEIGRLMAAIEHTRPRKRATMLRLAALTFVRPGELASAAWADISFESALWRIPAERMKMKRAHHVPLSRQALAALRELHKMTGKYPYCFPQRSDKHKHQNTSCLTWALRRMGYDRNTMTGHGFRAMAATILSEEGWASELIERQLAHADRNKIRAAYQRSDLLEERRKMMQFWADWLDVRCAHAILGR